jgi:hypothetical protein
MSGMFSKFMSDIVHTFIGIDGVPPKPDIPSARERS